VGIASLTLGITALFAWIDPFIGIPICIAGVIVGVIALTKSEENKKKATFGLVFSFMGLVAGVIWAFVGVGALLEIMNDINVNPTY